MVSFRAILPFVLFAMVFAPGFAWAADESISAQPAQMEVENTAQPVQLAQSARPEAENAARTDGSRPATREDIDRLDASVRKDIEQLDASVKKDIEQLDASVKKDIEQLDARMGRMENRIDVRMDRMENRVDAQISELRREMKELFYLVLVLMVALFGVPQFPNWWEKLRRNGKVVTAAGVLLAMLSMLLAGAAIAGMLS